jgi:hypothetical protein
VISIGPSSEARIVGSIWLFSDVISRHTRIANSTVYVCNRMVNPWRTRRTGRSRENGLRLHRSEPVNVSELEKYRIDIVRWLELFAFNAAYENSSFHAIRASGFTPGHASHHLRFALSAVILKALRGRPELVRHRSSRRDAHPRPR